MTTEETIVETTDETVEEPTYTLAETLAAECFVWHSNMIAKHDAMPPSTFTGVKADGEQFDMIMGGVEWTREELSQKRAFMHWIANEEDLFAYAYASRVVTQEDDMELAVYAEDDVMQVQVFAQLQKRDDGRLTADTPNVFKGCPPHGLRAPYANLWSEDAAEIEDGDMEFFTELWAARREKCLWRRRPTSPAPKQIDANLR